MKKLIRKISALFLAAFTALSFTIAGFATDSSADGVSGQIISGINGVYSEVMEIAKNIANNVIIPLALVVVAIFVIVGIVKIVLDYRNHEKVRWGSVIVPLVVLIVLLIIPSFLWTLIGV